PSTEIYILSLHDALPIYFHPLGAPPEDAVRGRVAASDDIDPKSLLGGRFEQIGFDVEGILLGKLLHARQRAFDSLDDGRNLDAGDRKSTRLNSSHLGISY